MRELSSLLKKSMTLAWTPFSIKGFFLMLRILMDFALTFSSFLRSVIVISLRVFICLYFFTVLLEMTFLIACWSSLLLFLLAIFISSEITFAKRSLFLIGLGITLGLTPASLISERHFESRMEMFQVDLERNLRFFAVFLSWILLWSLFVLCLRFSFSHFNFWISFLFLSAESLFRFLVLSPFLGWLKFS